MNMNGTLDSNSAITLPRLLERIFDTDRPGELRLQKADGSAQASINIANGEVTSTVFGDLKNKEATNAILSSLPWNFEFVPKGSVQGDGRLSGPKVVRAGAAPLRAAPLRAAPAGLKVARVGTAPNANPATEQNAPQAPANAAPAIPLKAAVPLRPPTEEESTEPASPLVIPRKIKLTPTQLRPPEPQEEKPEPVDVAATSIATPTVAEIATPAVADTAAAPTTPAPAENTPSTRSERTVKEIGMELIGGTSFDSTSPTPPKPVFDITSPQSLESLERWINGQGPGAIRFFDFNNERRGELYDEEWEYLQGDRGFLAHVALTVSAALGLGRCTMQALVEPQRAAAYWRVNSSGSYCGEFRTENSSITEFIGKF